MAPVIIDMPVYVLGILLISLITGIPLALYLRKEFKEELRIIEVLILSIIIGIVTPAILEFLALILLPLKFTIELAIVSYLVSMIIGIILISYESKQKKLDLKNFQEELESLFNDTIKDIEEILELKIELLPIYASYLFLILGIAIVFFITLSRYSPVGFELDPYFYLYPSRPLIEEGTIPFREDIAWYPANQNEVLTTHRQKNLINFIVANFYLLVYKQLKPEADLIYDLSLAANIFAPLMAVAAVSLTFFIFKQIRTEIAGFVAGLAGMLQRVIESFATYSFQLEPLGIMGIFFVTYAYFRLHKTINVQNALLLILSLATVYLGSKSLTFFHMLICIHAAVMVGIISLKYKENEQLEKLSKNLKPFVIYTCVFFAVNAVLAIWTPYSLNENKDTNALTKILKFSLLDTETIIPISILGFGLWLYICNVLAQRKILKNHRISLVVFYGLAITIALIVFPYFRTIGSNFLGFTTYNAPLERTIAEQGLSGDILEPEFGFIAIALTGLGEILGIFTIIANTYFMTFASILNAVLNFEVPISYNSLSPTLLFFFYVCSVAYLLYRLITSKFSAETNFELFVFLGLTTLFFLTLIKVKFHIYMTILIIFMMGFFFEMVYGILSKINLEKDIKIALMITALALIPILQYSQISSESMGIHEAFFASFSGKYSDNPNSFKQKFNSLCMATKDPFLCLIASSQNITIVEQHNPTACYLSQLENPLKLISKNQISRHEQYVLATRCRYIQQGWLEAYEWMKNNVPEYERITSWWDYGHWTVYFGERKTVLRNDHLSKWMIGEVAYSYVMGNETALRETMKKFNSSYAIFDSEIIFGGNVFGGKFNALNYLACAHANQTDVTRQVGISECEAINRWDYLKIQNEVCEISPVKKIKGQIGVIISINTTIPVCIFTESNKSILETYLLNKKNDFGELEYYTKIILFGPDYIQTSGLNIPVYHVAYLNLEDLNTGKISTQSRFYFSSLYKAFILEQLEGYDMVFKSQDGSVKIFKLKEN